MIYPPKIDRELVRHSACERRCHRLCVFTFATSSDAVFGVALTSAGKTEINQSLDFCCALALTQLDYKSIYSETTVLVKSCVSVVFNRLWPEIEHHTIKNSFINESSLCLTN
jgi:hypothetical protein